MMRHSIEQALARLASKSALAALVVATGTTWVVAQDARPVRPGTIEMAQATGTPSASPSADAFTASQKSAIEAIIKDYLIANPELMLEVQSALEAKMETIQAEKLKTALTANADEIFRSPGAPLAGNVNGDIPVVEFFDYNCGYCKRAFIDIAKLVEVDPKIKLVLKELPILSKGSEEAARVALAAKLQDKYWLVHRALLGIKGEVNEQSALRALEKLPGGIDLAKLKKDMTSDQVTGEISRVRELAQKMGIQGTPHFLVGDRAIAGAPGNLLAQIQGHVEDLRKSGCKVC